MTHDDVFLEAAEHVHLGQRGGLGSLVRGYVSPGPLRDLVTDGIVGGIAGSVVFLPQICLLFFFISLLEDTGYLARAAFVMDRLLYRFGLPGHAFVPLLTSLRLLEPPFKPDNSLESRTSTTK